MLGLQAYTVREHLGDRDTARNAMHALREMGYECIQLWAWKELTAVMADAACEAGLPVTGILGSIAEFEDGDIFALAHRTGAREIGISSSMKTEEEAAYTIRWANDFAKKAKAEGLTFSYHNHSNEFIRAASGKTLMQLLIEGFDEENVLFMPDTYWLQHGGVDVRAFLESLRGRVRTLHLKDMKRTIEGPAFAEIGRGNLNFPGILEVARAIGVEDLIVEQDRCDESAMDSARISCEYLRKIL